MEKKYPYYWSFDDRVFKAQDPCWSHQLESIMDTPIDAQRAVFLLNEAINNTDANIFNWKEKC